MLFNRTRRSVIGFLPVVLVVSMLLMASCAKNEPRPGGEVTNTEVNKWIVDSMRYYYYWNTSIPQDRNLNFNSSPQAFFESLLNRPADRFSWIQNAEDLRNELSGIIKTSGLGFGFFRIGERGAGAAIRYVLKGSPADLAGIKRGDIFTRVNGIELTVDSEGYVENYQPLQGNEPFTLTRGIINGNVISEGEEISITPVENFQEKAIHMDSILTTANGTKVAYLFYNRFLSNQAQELIDAFNRFKAGGVSELIIDERYNGGGDVGVASLLSALTHKGFNINSDFIRYEFNNNFRDAVLTYADLFGAENGNVVSANNLGLSRVFILATGSSASASELVINNLRPFLGAANVVHIGGTTRGKDDASITIVNSSPRFKGENDWGIQPIVLKYKNRNGEGNFVNGLTPTYEVVETVPFAPMGSAEDPLIGSALGIIDPSMRSTLSRQMSVQRQRLAAGFGELSRMNEKVSNIVPLDVTHSLDGVPLKIR
ncbi:hypothetical protein JHJ32_15355 [Parapedobacter sp. ISTM3]|uniref:C-terminal processing protease CtpA/Prc, contains a PDZ domain n=1 Tax=Parapedobacter luteus TaxID=623280 RepID=A0A1T5EJJ8_9SPHI|nr:MULTISPECIES: S41 family peptidase [Parapedobacter]MBK1441376.1 hypothetical protein [Parapedobacter sp. ISTM3]SKB84203.1 C-terminal processing protease CtpA/Prc, contains a PDZ domain [Parapedobacter luteus]